MSFVVQLCNRETVNDRGDDRREADGGLRGTVQYGYYYWMVRHCSGQSLGRIRTGTGGSTMQQAGGSEQSNAGQRRLGGNSLPTHEVQEEGSGARSAAAAKPSQNVDGGRRPLELEGMGWKGGGCVVACGFGARRGSYQYTVAEGRGRKCRKCVKCHCRERERRRQVPTQRGLARMYPRGKCPDVQMSSQSSSGYFECAPLRTEYDRTINNQRT